MVPRMQSRPDPLAHSAVAHPQIILVRTDPDPLPRCPAPPHPRPVIDEPTVPDWLRDHVAWDALVACSGASVYLVDDTFNVVYANPTGASIVGAKSQEMVGTPLGLRFSDALAGVMRSFITNALLSGRVQVEPLLYRGELRRSHFVPVNSGSGRFDHVLIVSHGAPDLEHPIDSIDTIAPLLGSSDTRAEALGPLAKLSRRELEIIRLIGDGMKTAVIASTLNLSPRTIHNHCASMSKKMGGCSKSEMAKRAVRAGLCRPRALSDPVALVETYPRLFKPPGR